MIRSDARLDAGSWGRSGWRHVFSKGFQAMRNTPTTADGLHHDVPHVWRCKLTSLRQLNQYMSSWTLRLAKLQTDPIDEATIEHQSMLQFLMNICLQGFSRTVATTHSFFTSSIERARGSKVLARPLRHHDWLYLGDLVSPLNKLSNSSQQPRCFLNMKFYLGQTNRFKTPAPPVPLQPFNHLATSEIECHPLRPYTSNFIIQ